jgi:hypothetical protein
MNGASGFAALIECRSPLSVATVIRMPTGIRQLRYPRSARYAPPTRMTSAAVSPRDPAVVPRTRSISGVLWPSNLRRPSGVAEVIASGCAWVNGSAKRSPRGAQKDPPACGQVVIATGNAACRNARPTSAGLNALNPSPPQIDFPKTMANAAPRKVIQSGKPAGSERPSNSPVITADPSPSDPPLPVARSASTAADVAVAS